MGLMTWMMIMMDLTCLGRAPGNTQWRTCARCVLGSNTAQWRCASGHALAYLTAHIYGLFACSKAARVLASYAAA